MAEQRFDVATSDGARLSCRADGMGEPCIVLVHGWSCNQRFFRPQFEMLAGHYRVVAFDLAGHGQSTATARDWTIRQFAGDVLAVMEECEGPVVLVGHSMGGAVVLEAAARANEKLQGVVVVDTFVFDYGHFDEAAIEQVMTPFEEDFPEAIRSLVRSTLPADVDAALYDFIVSEMSAARREVAIPAFRSLLDWNAERVLGRISRPIHCINGSLINETARERYRQYWTEHVIPNAGHFLQLEDPVRFNECLTRVLAEITQLSTSPVT